jgi:hypothetical protein
MLLALCVFSGCKPKEWTAPSRTEAPPNVPLVFVQVYVTHSNDGFRTLDGISLNHQFMAPSGHMASYDSGPLRLDVVPQINGDKTISTSLTLRRKSEEGELLEMTQVSKLTVIDGREVTHEAGKYRFACTAIADLSYVAYMAARLKRNGFPEGYYVPCRSGFGDETLRFGNGHFVAHTGRDTGPRPYHDRHGHYEVDEENVYLTFDDPSLTSRTLVHLTLDDVDVLMDRDDIKRQLYRGRSYARLPAEMESDPDWWPKLLKAHPDFTKAHGLEADIR